MIKLKTKKERLAYRSKIKKGNVASVQPNKKPNLFKRGIFYIRIQS